MQDSPTPPTHYYITRSLGSPHETIQCAALYKPPPTNKGDLRTQNTLTTLSTIQNNNVHVPTTYIVHYLSSHIYISHTLHYPHNTPPKQHSPQTPPPNYPLPPKQKCPPPVPHPSPLTPPASRSKKHVHFAATVTVLEYEAVEPQRRTLTRVEALKREDAYLQNSPPPHAFRFGQSNSSGLYAAAPAATFKQRRKKERVSYCDAFRRARYPLQGYDDELVVARSAHAHASRVNSFTDAYRRVQYAPHAAAAVGGRSSSSMRSRTANPNAPVVFGGDAFRRAAYASSRWEREDDGDEVVGKERKEHASSGFLKAVEAFEVVKAHLRGKSSSGGVP